MRGFLLLSAYNAISEALHVDAAPGRRSTGNAGACGNSLAKASRNAEATYEGFMLAARQYLSTAGARTCEVTCDGDDYHEYDLGFRTRRDGDYLYVTEVTHEDRLEVGMRIVAVGKNTVPFLLKDLGADVFWGRGTDREDWDLVMRMYDDIDVFPGDGTVKRLDLRHFPVEAWEPEASVEYLDTEKAIVARIDDLMDVNAAQRVALGIGDLLARGARKLVVDLRHTRGEAAPEALLELLPFLVDATVEARNLMGDTDIYTIYSKNNANILVGDVERACAGADEGTRALADEVIDQIRSRAAEVLEAKKATHIQAERLKLSEVAEVIPSPFDDEVVPICPNPADTVCILVDSTTGIGGERLAQAVMNQRRVRIVGRQTPGALDYANYVTIALEGIGCTFSYPISRTKANHDGVGYDRAGLPLDVHVPFEARECSHDAILEAALRL